MSTYTYMYGDWNQEPYSTYEQAEDRLRRIKRDAADTADSIRRMTGREPRTTSTYEIVRERGGFKVKETQTTKD